MIPRYYHTPWNGSYNQQNQNQGPYLSYPLGYQQPHQQQPGAGRDYQPPPGPPPEGEFAPPPPYPGKPKGYDGEENSGYGYPNAPEYAPSPGGFVAPPSPDSPPPAHVNSDVRVSPRHPHGHADVIYRF